MFVGHQQGLFQLSDLFSVESILENNHSRLISIIIHPSYGYGNLKNEIFICGFSQTFSE